LLIAATPKPRLVLYPTGYPIQIDDQSLAGSLIHEVVYGDSKQLLDRHERITGNDSLNRNGLVRWSGRCVRKE
jgi:hypothetical protein